MRHAPWLVTLALLAAIVLAGCMPTSCEKRGDSTGKEGTHAAERVTVPLSKDATASFTFGGAKHTATMVSAAGSSVAVMIATSPEPYVITEGQSSRADLNADSLPEVELTVSGVSASKATLTVAEVPRPVFDESSFETTGGLAPFGVVNYYELDPSVVVLDDGSYLLFYIGEDGGRVQWEHYRADGTQILAPQLGAGRVTPVPGLEVGEYIDTVRIGDSIFLASEQLKGTFITAYDLEMRQQGAASFITPWRENSALATDGKRMWLATQEAAKVYRPTDSTRPAVAVMELAPGMPPTRMRQGTVTDPPDGRRDVAPDIAYDAATGLLAVPYERFTNATNDYELRLVVVDPKTLKPVRDVQIATSPKRVGGGESGMAVLASGGKATVLWQSGGAVFHHVNTVDLRSGAVRTTFEGTNKTGVPGLTMNNWDVELVPLKDGRTALLYLDRFASGKKNPTDGERHRFLLAPLTEQGGPKGDPIQLDGGQPIFADVAIDLESLHANPKKAICGSPCLLMGSVVNRGSRQATKVRLEVMVDGKSIGSVDLGVIQVGDTNRFAKVWDVPADLTSEQVKVTYKLTTTAVQYTTGNDTAETTVEVRQKGLVQGRVTNGSGVTDLGWWAGGLEGVKVSFGGKTVLTDQAGAFAIEEVEFGSGTLTATKDGYNPVSVAISTSRTKPITSVGIRMDDHGTLRIRTVDESGAPLKGVTAFLLGYDRSDASGDDGSLVYSIPKGTYRFAFKKEGYHAVPPTEYTVELGQDRTVTITLREATTAKVAGRLVDKDGNGVAGTVQIKNGKGEVVASPAVNAEGYFAEVELSVKPPQVYTLVATGAGLTVEDPISIRGGEVRSLLVRMVQSASVGYAGKLRGRAATEGYTAWMIKTGWPGFMSVGGTTIYVWYGNYAMRVGAQYWDKSRDLSEITVTSWGGTYETHVTKGEIEIDVSGDDLVGAGAKKGLPPAMADSSDAPSGNWFKRTAKSAVKVYKEYSDVIDLTKSIVSGIKDVKDAFSSEDEWIVLGQGSEILTWKEALDDFDMRPTWDSSDPVGSIMSVKDAIPTSFAIPIVIGGSSKQDTAVRVDGIDVVNSETGEIYVSDRQQWYSYRGTEDDGSNFRRLEITQEGVPADKTRVFVWVRLQKYWAGELNGTCFYPREQQVIIFDVGKGGMKAFIAPGDMYLAPERWDDKTIKSMQVD
jgi:hypothetical protein